jgi:hypothetical protein
LTDAGLAHVQGLPKLRELYVTQTKVTEEGRKALKKAMPELDINAWGY